MSHEQIELFPYDAQNFYPEHASWKFRAASWFLVPKRLLCRWCAAEEDCPRHGPSPLRPPPGHAAGRGAAAHWYDGPRDGGVEHEREVTVRRARRPMPHELDDEGTAAQCGRALPRARARELFPACFLEDSDED